MRMQQITPFVPCTSVERQIEFYTQTLGFTLGYHADNYAYLSREGVAIRLIGEEDGVDLSVPERENSFYIDVEEIDALYASMEPALSKLPEGRVRAPFDQLYGQREFHVIDEDCTLIFFGEAISR
ncbi:VOC family protein [Rhodobacteraceae bacterium NNCM2]|nr:VOC family protein [Coraliihabitans acroporae]